VTERGSGVSNNSRHSMIELEAIDADLGTLNAIIDMPKGSRNKVSKNIAASRTGARWCACLWRADFDS